jgi:pimeloyl-ACP methyl ester carboxylesterase
MSSFRTFDGITLSYQAHGEGPEVLLLHGFASDTSREWQQTGTCQLLAGAGYRCIGLDARGHGRSAKPHQPAAYADDAMARDAICLLDYLGIQQAAIAGYSMGAAVALRAALRAPARVRCLILGGTTGSLITQPDPQAASRRERIAAALLAEDPGTVSDATGQELRRFADATGADRIALAAAQRAVNRFGPPSDCSAIHAPALVICGDRDVSPAELASILPNAHTAIVPGDHVSAVNAPQFGQELRRFLDSLTANPAKT